MPQIRRLTRPQQDDDYEEDEAPRRLRTPEPPARRSSHRNADDDRGLAVAKGRAGYKRVKANAPSPFTKLYKVGDDEGLIMLLENEPYASFLQHWCDWVGRGQRQSYICLQEDCPLDEVDPKPAMRVRWNILDCSGDQPIHMPFECGIAVSDMLLDWGENEPLSGRYFGIQMKGPKRSRRTQIRPVKIRDLEEDWDFVALSEDAIEGFDLFDEKTLDVSSRQELRQVADAFNE